MSGKEYIVHLKLLDHKNGIISRPRTYEDSRVKILASIRFIGTPTMPGREWVFRFPANIIQFLSANKTKDFVDCGSHQGLYASLYANYFRKFVAIEPDTRNIAVMLSNLKNDNLIIVQAPVYNRESIVRFHISTRTSINKIVKKLSPDIKEKLFMPATTLSKIASRFILNPGVIKLDIEGCEAEALQGASQILEVSRPTLLVEIHNETDTKLLSDIINKFRYTKLREYLSNQDGNKRVVFVPHEHYNHIKSLLESGG